MKQTSRLERFWWSTKKGTSFSRPFVRLETGKKKGSFGAASHGRASVGMSPCVLCVNTLPHLLSCRCIKNMRQTVPYFRHVWLPSRYIRTHFEQTRPFS